MSQPKRKNFSKLQDKKTNLAQGVLIYGKHAVESAVLNPCRKIMQAFATKEQFAYLKKNLLDSGRGEVSLKLVDKAEMDKMFAYEAVHQGVALVCEPLQGISLQDIISLSAETDDCHILVLDQVSDPQNIGAIIRSCAAFGALALVVQDKNTPQESGAMVKASAGTIEFLPICRVTNLSRALETLKNNGFWCVGMDGYASQTIDLMNKKGKIAVVMGSEGKGMRRLVQESCDETVKLLTDPRVESLNVSVAAAIALYEIAKK